MSITSGGGYRAYAVCLPDDQLRFLSTSEGLQPSPDLQPIPIFRDALLVAGLLRLSMCTTGRGVSEDIGDEIAARHVILQLCAAVGGLRPEWHRDSSVFTPVVMRRIVEHMDSVLGSPVSLESIARNVSLSPGHFARKFHLSTGLSLNRFMHRRRIGLSFAMLKDGERPLSGIALDLGFSSQSHFTSLFSQLTGFTPQRFRRLHLRMGE